MTSTKQRAAQALFTMGATALFTLNIIWAETLSAQVVTSLAPMIESVSPSVVNISVSSTPQVSNPLAENPFFRGFLEPQPRPVQGAGSGVIVDASKGLILTNHHVIENADEITVTLFDDRAATATVIGSDQASDLAVVKIDIENLSEIRLGDSDSLRVGDFVVAIGNPFGFSHTVTSGIVSGLGRNGVNPDRSAYEDFIQTDASINPGNSGGALVTLNGELVGINSAIISRGGGNIGIGFAIPIGMARNVMDQLVEYGEVQRGLLGVQISRITRSLVEQYGLSDTAGAFVTDITPSSAAEAAGLQIQDVIIAVDGRPVAGPDSLRNMIGLHRPGDTVEIDFIRDGTTQQTTAVLGAVVADRAAEIQSPEPEISRDQVFPGVVLEPDEGGGGIVGLRVIEIEEGGSAAAAGLRRGDLVLRLNRQRVTTLAQAEAVVRNSPNGVVALVRRGNRDSIVLLP